MGKTTALRRAADALSDLKIRGFITGDIREGRERVGFRLQTFDGDEAVLAQVNIRSPHRVGRYGVDLTALDRIAADQLSGRGADVVFVDEIGKMETLSKTFVEKVEALLDSPTLVVATVGLRGEGFIEKVKQRRDIFLWKLTRANRDHMPGEIAAWVRERVGA